MMLRLSSAHSRTIHSFYSQYFLTLSTINQFLMQSILLQSIRFSYNKNLLITPASYNQSILCFHRDQKDEAIFEEAMEEVNKEAVNLDSLTKNIKELDSQVNRNKHTRK